MATSDISNQLGSLLGELGNLVKAKLSEQANPKPQAGPDTDAVDAAIVAALSLAEQNAKELENHLLAVSAGKLSVSAGAVHQSIERLLAKGYLTSRLEVDRQVYGLSAEGKLFASEFKKAVADEPAEDSQEPAGSAGSQLDFYREASKLAPVMLDLAQTGSAAQRAEAGKLLQQLRHELHTILANKP